MKKKRVRKNPVNDKINRLLEMPREISSKDPKLTIVGFEQMLIENYKGILEYEDFYIKINTYIGAININGFNLSLRQMTDDDIMISGKIESIDLERMIDDEEESLDDFKNGN